MNAWKLPAAMLVLLAVNSVMAEFYRFGLGFWDHVGLLNIWQTYAEMWFASRRAGWAAWLLCHLALLTCGFRYYRTGSSGWGWLLALSAILCSTTGAYYLRLFF